MAGSTKDEPLSKQEQEEEEMRHELSNAGLFEENMNINEMRDLMKALNASKIEMNESKTEINVRTSPILSSAASKPQISPETTKTILHRPLPSFSYRNIVLASDTTVAGPAYELLKKGKTSESVYDESFETSINQTDSPSNESTHEKNSFFNSDDSPSLNCRSGSKGNNDGPRLRSHGKKPTPTMVKKMNLDKFKINEFIFDENFKIPKEMEQANLKINPNCFDDEYLNSEKFQEMLEHMCKEMDKLHDQFVDAEVTKIIENQKSQWGAPIKVGTSKQTHLYLK
ncbi:uncharacterized protein LOC106637579 [Copidosoma floridanum]|uniref:uncharacterized protein LOC106637579 n=1 Tax=Copidosoma floridanum TaxID=29053 RepID=UPI0006C99346|nr:uncharacterized protein LOC106637579 [Copidosoma floridanum]